MLEGLKHLISLDRPLGDILRDIADILIVAFILYRALLVLKGTRAMQMGLGFVAFGLLYLVAKYAELATLMSVLSYLASSA
ncbi:MAG TPA: TIGR00159 family protein, partial [Polyangiaceae bacterium]|nr:TIGR00159 family protein [Polyangiaceae bacterium]